MAAGNASNTVFTAIPVGEDFYMSFSTERFHSTIAPQDFVSLNFKLYDARVIGDIGSPNPNAIIKQYNNQPVSPTNPNGKPTFFKTYSNSISVLVLAQELDTYERTKTGNNTAVFRGEIYGFIEAVVTGEETKFARLTPLGIRTRVKVLGDLQRDPINEFWDGYFFREDIRSISASSTVNSPTIGSSNGGV